MEAESGGKPFGAPIENGNYDILDHPDKNKLRLEANDSNYGNDIHDPTGRDLFRLHEPGRTVGCIAAKCTDEWESTRDVVRNTSSTTVEVNSKSRNPFAPKKRRLKIRDLKSYRVIKWRNELQNPLKISDNGGLSISHSTIYIHFCSLLSDIIRIFGKEGWTGRPFIYIQVETIVIYLVYTFSSLYFSFEVTKKHNNNITKASTIAIFLSLLFFWLSFLFNIARATIQT